MGKITHPLEMLSVKEIEQAIALLKAKNPEHESSQFSYIYLDEPGKEQIREFSAGDSFQRIAKVIGIDENSQGFEATINLTLI